MIRKVRFLERSLREYTVFILYIDIQQNSSKLFVYIYPFSAEVFSTYPHHEVLPGCMPHPGDIVEAGMLAVSLPDYW